jgi:nucleoside-diphosphate-sugar epimerase
MIVSADVTPVVVKDNDCRKIEIELDLRNRNELRDLAARFNLALVFDLASLTEVGLPGHAYAQNIDITRSMIDWVSRFNIPKYVFYSTQFVFRKEGAMPTGEQDYFPIDAYGEAKIQSERLIRSALAPNQWLILRPTYIWGEGHSRFRDGFLYRLAKGQMMVPISPNLQRYYGYVKTICEQTVQLSEVQFANLPLRTFYLSDAPVSLRWFCEQFLTVLGAGRVWSVPTTAIRTLGQIGEIARRIQLPFPINALQANEMTRNYPVPIDSTLVITKTATDYRGAAAAVIAWALSDPDFKRRIQGRA